MTLCEAIDAPNPHPRQGTTMPARLFGSFALAGAAQAATSTGPYWIVAGSFANPDTTQVQDGAVRRAAAAVIHCGFRPFNDSSGKFAGFVGGFDVVVVGGYTSRSTAEADLARLRRCVPTAYVRRGSYAGE